MAFFETKQDLIDHGFLNKDGVEDELLDCTGDPCCNCGRMRVEKYKSGMLVCEKCNVDQKTKTYVEDDYYRN